MPSEASEVEGAAESAMPAGTTHSLLADAAPVEKEEKRRGQKDGVSEWAAVA